MSFELAKELGGGFEFNLYHDSVWTFSDVFDDLALQEHAVSVGITWGTKLGNENLLWQNTLTGGYLFAAPDEFSAVRTALGTELTCRNAPENVETYLETCAQVTALYQRFDEQSRDEWGGEAKLSTEWRFRPNAALAAELAYTNIESSRLRQELSYDRFQAIPSIALSFDF